MKKLNALLRKASPFYLLLGAVIALGIALRFVHLGASGLWIDEAWMAAKALKPLAQTFADMAPTSRISSKFFVTILHWFVSAFGVTDATVRFLPALFGAASVPFMYLLARKLTGDRMIALLATSFLAFDALILRYSQEVKTYSGEMMCALILCYIAELMIERGYRRAWIIGLAVTNALAVIIFPATGLITAAIGARIAYDLWQRGWLARGKAALIAGVASYIAITIALFAANYLFFIQKPAAGVVTYALRKGFFAGAHDLWSLISFSAMKTFSLVETLFMYKHSFNGHTAVVWGLIILTGFGAWKLIREAKPAAAIYLCVPALLALIATLIQHFLYGVPRFNLLYTQFIFILVAAGAGAVLSIAFGAKRGKLIFAAAAAIIAIAYPFFLYDATGFYFYHPKEDVRTVIQWYSARVSPEDYTFVPFPADSAFSFYYLKGRSIYSKGADGHIVFLHSMNTKEGLLDPGTLALFKRAKGHRVWVIFQHFGKPDQERIMREGLRAICPVVETDAETGAAGYLLQC